MYFGMNLAKLTYLLLLNQVDFIHYQERQKHLQNIIWGLLKASQFIHNCKYFGLSWVFRQSWTRGDWGTMLVSYSLLPCWSVSVGPASMRRSLPRSSFYCRAVSWWVALGPPLGRSWGWRWHKRRPWAWGDSESARLGPVSDARRWELHSCVKNYGNINTIWRFVLYQSLRDTSPKKYSTSNL